MMAYDKDDVDLLIVMGSSLKVGPVNDIPDSLNEDVPRILSKCSQVFMSNIIVILKSIANHFHIYLSLKQSYLAIVTKLLIIFVHSQ